MAMDGWTDQFSCGASSPKHQLSDPPSLFVLFLDHNAANIESGRSRLCSFFHRRTALSLRSVFICLFVCWLWLQSRTRAVAVAVRVIRMRLNRDGSGRSGAAWTGWTGYLNGKALH
jgi:hypothetical protein